MRVPLKVKYLLKNKKFWIAVSALLALAGVTISADSLETIVSVLLMVVEIF